VRKPVWAILCVLAVIYVVPFLVYGAFTVVADLKPKELMEKTALHLSKGEAQALLARRDAMVDYFQRLIQQKGESAVLY
jgi:hypothetical protein